MAVATERIGNHSCNSQGASKSSFSNLLAQLPSGESGPLDEGMPYEVISAIENDEWPLAFEDSSTCRGGEAGIMLYASDGTDVSLSSNLEFSYSNNKAQYKL